MFFLNIPNNEQNPILTKTGLKLLAYKCIDENTADYQRLEYREMTLIYDAKIFRITGCIQLKPQKNSPFNSCLMKLLLTKINKNSPKKFASMATKTQNAQIKEKS